MSPVSGIADNDLSLLLHIVDRGVARDLCYNSKTLRLSRLEKLLDTGKTLCDISSGHASGMECTHGQLGTRLTDGLCRDDAYGLSYLYRLSGRHVGAVALRADADTGTAGQRGTDTDFLERLSVFIHAVFYDCGRTFRSNHMVCFHDHVSIFIADGLRRKTSGNTLFQGLDQLFAVCESAYSIPGISPFSLQSVSRMINS